MGFNEVRKEEHGESSFEGLQENGGVQCVSQALDRRNTLAGIDTYLWDSSHGVDATCRLSKLAKRARGPCGTRLQPSEAEYECALDEGRCQQETWR